MPFSAVPGALRSLASIGHIVEAAPERSLTVSSGRPAPVPDARGSHWLSCCEARRGARSPGTVRAGHSSRLQMFFSTIFPLNFLERCFLGDLYLSFCLSRSMRLAQAPPRPPCVNHASRYSLSLSLPPSLLAAAHCCHLPAPCGPLPELWRPCRPAGALTLSLWQEP